MRIAIVGGGSAGYLSALLFKKQYPEYEITVIDSSKIGILGAGEGTTPLFYDALKSLEISIEDFVKETKATVKNGIKFINWGTEKDFYFHAFNKEEIENIYLKNRDKKNITDKKTLNKIKEEVSFLSYTGLNYKNLDSINLPAICSYQNNVYSERHAWHVDARLLATFLNKQSTDRGIKIIDGVVDDIIFNKNNEIESLFIDNKIFDFDFFIDCSGFNRLIIGNHYKSEWISASESLPCDSALAFFMYDQQPMMHTESIAMNYGWAWRIPLQHRFGCGYVYDSKYITKEEAIEEVKEKFGNNIEIVNHFKFDPGYYKNPLIKNCLSVGLASSFFEPLEATSIHSSILMCKRFINLYANEYFKNKNKTIANKYNKEVNNLNEDIVSFLYFHYMTNKNNTSFWKDFTKDNFIPEKTNSYLNKINNDFFSTPFINNDSLKMFNVTSWMTVYFGNEIYKDNDLNISLNNVSKQKYEKRVKEMKESKIPMSMNKYLKNIKTIDNG
jgi:tryptophan halogenase